MNPHKLAKWKRWLGDANTHGTITRELVDLAIIREVFHGVREMVRNNSALQQHSAFHSVFSLNYSHSVLMYVRRQVRRNQDSAGLIELAHDLRDNCNLVTQDYYIGLYAQNAIDAPDREELERWGRSVFLEKFGGTVKTYLDPLVIEADIADLNAIADASSSFTDRRLAHLDRREPKRIPTHQELDRWCDTLNDKLKKYISLLDAADFRIPPVLSHDWRAIFRTAWLPGSRSS
jgi:hypothetical protein